MQTFTLPSLDNALVTREECRRLLEELGVYVIVENTEGAGTLKCRVEEIRDPSGNHATVKALKFRVEFTTQTFGTPLSQSPALNSFNSKQFNSFVTLVMEKGAHSTFKIVQAHLRNLWEYVS